jgi:glutamine cyclotransferase
MVLLDSESWGLCSDGTRLVRSDGTDRLHFHDAANLAEAGSIAVTRNGTQVTGLNELDCVDGQVWAGAWPTDEFVRIDPATGAVTAVLNATGLLNQPRTNAHVLSGIAHLAGDEYLLTGKYWPSTFRIRVTAAD